MTFHETFLRDELASAYHILAAMGLDDLTYTHLSLRAQDPHYFYIAPFGLLFEEVTARNLLQVDLDGNIVAGEETHYNPTAYMIHGSIYKARPDIHASFHLHTRAGVAVSASQHGLLPISQFALHFYERLAYHSYDSLALDAPEGQKMVQDLGDKYVMILRNHGTLMCGRTIAEAFFYTHHLEQACRVQCEAGNNPDLFVYPDPAVCRKATQDLLTFERNLGERDWAAAKRWVKNRGK